MVIMFPSNSCCFRRCHISWHCQLAIIELIVQDRVTVEERPAATVLSNKAAIEPILDRKCQSCHNPQSESDQVYYLCGECHHTNLSNIADETLSSKVVVHKS